MSQNLTKEEQEFAIASSKHRTEKIEELAYKALAIALKENIPVFELPYYVLQRARGIIGEAFNKVDFNNPKLKAARKKFMKECLAELKTKIPIYEKQEEKDETATRDNGCEPVARAIVDFLLDEELIFSDDNYFDKVLENEESVPLNAAIAGYGQALDEKLLMVISRHWSEATEKMMGVPKERLTFTQLNDILKVD